MKKHLTIIFLVISMKGFSQQPIFATGSSGQIYSVDLTNCSSHIIGTGHQYGDIALTSDGRLWGIDNGNLYQIDTTNASYTLIGNYGTGGVGGVSIVSLDDSTLLTESGMNLYGVRISNLSTYLIGYIGYQAAGDLTWYDDDLYMATSAGLIIKMVLDSTYSTILSVTPIGNAIPTCEGAITAPFIGDYNSIIGFNGPNVIKICQLDGTYQTLCPALLTFGTGGAASFRLSTQIPQPTSCSMTGIQDYPVNELFSIYPNPSTGAINIPKEYIDYELKVYDITGRIVFNNPAFQSSTIDLRFLPSGCFIVQLMQEEKAYRAKLILQ